MACMIKFTKIGVLANDTARPSPLLLNVEHLVAVNPSNMGSWLTLINHEYDVLVKEPFEEVAKLLGVSL